MVDIHNQPTARQSWPPLIVEEWTHFTRIAASAVGEMPLISRYLFRGQSRAEWALKPSLLRLFSDGTPSSHILPLEQFALNEFRSHAHLYLDPGALPDEYPKSFAAEWWAIMQHHGAPTRMLDWTSSPYVAAYFAVERDWDCDGAIYIINTIATSKDPEEKVAATPRRVSNEDLFSSSSSDRICVWTPNRRTERLAVQQGAFTFSVNVAADQAAVIAKRCETFAQRDQELMIYCKALIPARLKREFLGRLRSMNITSRSLFPGIDGLGRELAEAARIGWGGNSAGT